MHRRFSRLGSGSAERVADAISLARFRALDLRVETKPDLTPVTDADRAVEHALLELLEARAARRRRARRGARTRDGATGRRWILDPIDGTRNFVRGIPRLGDADRARGGRRAHRRRRVGARARPALVGAARRRRLRGRRSALRVSGVSRDRGRRRRVRRASSARRRRSRRDAWHARGLRRLLAARARRRGRRRRAPSTRRPRPGTSPPFGVIVEEAGGTLTALRGRRSSRRTRLLHEEVLARAGWA